MQDLKAIWNPIEVYTIKNKLLLIEIDSPRENITMDHAWGKITSDGNILFEFNPGESKNYKLMGTVTQCGENPELLNEVICELYCFGRSNLNTFCTSAAFKTIKRLL